MAYTAPTLSTLITRCQGDIQSAMTTAPDGTTRPVPYLLMVLCRDGIGTAMAGISWGLHKGLEYLFQEATPLAATQAGLLASHGAAVNRFPIAASPTRLVVRIWGTAGSEIPAGSYATRDDGTVFNLASGYTYATTTYWDATVEAAVAGAAANTAAGVILTLANPPAGVTAACIVQSQSQAGADAETDAIYRPAVIAAYQGAGAGGGTIADWQAWCVETVGVESALVTSPSAGVIAIEIVGPGGTTPDAAVVTACQLNLSQNHVPADVSWTVAAWVP